MLESPLFENTTRGLFPLEPPVRRSCSHFRFAVSSREIAPSFPRSYDACPAYFGYALTVYNQTNVRTPDPIG